MRMQRRLPGAMVLSCALVMIGLVGAACGGEADSQVAVDAEAQSRTEAADSAAAPQRAKTQLDTVAAAEVIPAPAVAADAASLQVFVDRNRRGEENSLHSEFFVNNTLVNIFSTDTQKRIGQHIKPAWNTITIRTTRQPHAPSPNGLSFAIGPVEPNPQQEASVMRPVLWSFGNQRGWDWERDTGHSYRLDRNTTTTTHTYHLYFAGLDADMAQLKEGDYILTGQASRRGEDVPFTGTIFINGTPLNSFVVAERQVVITPLLKQGKNEVKLVTTRVDGAVLSDNNGLSFTIAGPARYNAREKKFQMTQVADFIGGVGWTFDEKTGAAVSKENPAANAVERIIPLFLDEAPGVAAGSSS